MAEYINREVLRKVLSHELVDADTGTPMDFYNMGIRTLRRMIEDIPAADVRPVEHGEWTAEGNDEIGNYWDECTACRKAVWFPPSVKNDYKYCPHCGAKMDGET